MADRIIFIEGKLGGQGTNAEVIDAADGFSPVGVNDSTKRPFSSISGDANTTPVTNRLAAWASEQRISHQTSSQSYGRGRLIAKRTEAEAPGRPVETTDGLFIDVHDEVDRDIDETVFSG